MATTETIPNTEKLDELLGALYEAHEAIEDRVKLPLGSIYKHLMEDARPTVPTITAEEAWKLHRFAYYLETFATNLLQEAARIEQAVDGLASHQEDLEARAGEAA